MQNEVSTSLQVECARALLREYMGFLDQEMEGEPGQLIIRILGPGCPRCHRLASEMKEVLAELQLAADVLHVRDPTVMAEYGLLAPRP